MEKPGALGSPLLSTLHSWQYNIDAENRSEDAGEEGRIFLRNTVTDTVTSLAERSETRVTEPEQNQAQISLPGDQRDYSLQSS